VLDEMASLHASGTWELVQLLPEKATFDFQWVFIKKVGVD